MKTIHSEEDVINFQATLDTLYNWEHENNMRFNAKKFKWLQIGKNEKFKNDYVYMSYDCIDPIVPDTDVRDLGIIMNCNGDYSSHINFICKKAKQRIGYILRSFNCRDIDFMRFIWKVYVGPILDYCSQLYGPTKGPNLMKLENILKSFTSKVSGIGHLHYWERLEKIKLYSISRRNERYRMIYIFKSLNGFTDNCGIFSHYTENSGRLLHCINAGKYAVSLRENSFHYIGPRLYNSLPRYLRDDYLSTPAQWKTKLDELLSLIPDQPSTTEGVTGVCDPNTALPSNSILHWLPTLGLSNRRSTKEHI